METAYIQWNVANLAFYTYSLDIAGAYGVFVCKILTGAEFLYESRYGIRQRVYESEGHFEGGGSRQARRGRVYLHVDGRIVLSGGC